MKSVEFKIQKRRQEFDIFHWEWFPLHSSKYNYYIHYTGESCTTDMGQMNIHLLQFPLIERKTERILIVDKAN